MRYILSIAFNFFCPQLNDFFGITLLDKNEDYFRKIFWESMNAREKSNVKIGDIIDFLVDLKNGDQSSEFSKKNFSNFFCHFKAKKYLIFFAEFEGDNLLAQAIVFLLAGLESSAATMGFVLYEVSKNPEIQKKLREEIDQKLGNDKLTFEAVSDLSYLQQVISETLRLYAPVPFLDRLCNMNYKVMIFF